MRPTNAAPAISMFLVVIFFVNAEKNVADLFCSRITTPGATSQKTRHLLPLTPVQHTADETGPCGLVAKSVGLSVER